MNGPDVTGPDMNGPDVTGLDRARSFGAAVGAYELGRPGYAAAHVAWLLDGVGGRVEAPTMVGTAEAIPLQDDSVAAVTVGQAWHWFDPNAAGPEIARVLTPGGRLGLVWNIRDVRQPFVAALAEVMGPSPAEAMIDGDAVQPVPGFTAFERRRFETVRMITPEALEALVTSRSHWLVAAPATQAAVLSDVRQLVATHPHSAGRRLFEFEMVTACYRADALA